MTKQYFAMTKGIKFMHAGQFIDAIAIFNFEKNNCSVMVMPLSCNDEFGESILLVRSGNKWKTESNVQSVSRLTYSQLLNEIDLAINEYQAFHEVDAQRLLS